MIYPRFFNELLNWDILIVVLGFIPLLLIFVLCYFHYNYLMRWHFRIIPLTMVEVQDEEYDMEDPTIIIGTNNDETKSVMGVVFYFYCEIYKLNFLRI